MKLNIFDSFTMFLKDAAPACECCRKRVEVSASVTSNLVGFFVCIRLPVRCSAFHDRFVTLIMQSVDVA